MCLLATPLQRRSSTPRSRTGPRRILLASQCHHRERQEDACPWLEGPVPRAKNIDSEWTRILPREFSQLTAYKSLHYIITRAFAMIRSEHEFRAAAAATPSRLLANEYSVVDCWTGDDVVARWRPIDDLEKVVTWRFWGREADRVRARQPGHAPPANRQRPVGE